MIQTPQTRLDTHRVWYLPFSHRGLERKLSIDTPTPPSFFISLFSDICSQMGRGACLGVYLPQIHCKDKWRWQTPPVSKRAHAVSTCFTL
jgi:hypothetical protein